MYWKSRKEEGGIIYKKCSDCGEWLPETTENFYMRNKKKQERGLTSKCKKCSIKESQSNYDPKRHTELTNYYYHNNEEYKKKNKSYTSTPEQKEKQRKWRQSEKGKEYMKERGRYRQQHKKHKISKLEWLACKKYFYNSCAYCGLPIEEHYNIYAGKLRKEDLHKEHVDDKGINNLSNCVPACKSCNSEKHTDILEIWYNENNKKFTQERYDKIIKWIKEDYKLYIETEKPKRTYKRKKVS